MAGSYAVGSFEVPWASTPVIAQSKKKSKSARQVVNPVFSGCAAVTPDPYWADVLTSASYGKLPRRFGFRDGCLTYKKSSKIISLPLPPAPHEALSAAVDFFKHYGGMLSPADQETERAERFYRAELEAQRPDDGWGDFSKKMKQALISNFVVEQESKYGLDLRQKKELYYVLNRGIFQGCFSRDNILVEKKRIVEIRGLLFDPQRKSFSLDPDLKPKQQRASGKSRESGRQTESLLRDKTPLFHKNWTKYLAELENRWSRYARLNEEMVLEEESDTEFSSSASVDSSDT